LFILQTGGNLYSYNKLQATDTGTTTLFASVLIMLRVEVSELV